MLPAATSLKKQGANKGATTAFLISTPESGVDSIAITYALLDPLMTIVRPFAAFISAICAGLLENITHPPVQARQPLKTLPVVPLHTEGQTGSPAPGGQSKISRIVGGVRFAVVDVWGDIATWFFAGLLIAGVITVVVPEEFMAQWLGGGLVSMLVMLVIGVPLYICASASTPIAAALILKGVSPGAALVFLLVGPATNITTLSVLFGLLGRASTFRYLFVLALCAVLFGLTTDALYALLDISPQVAMGEAAEVIPSFVKHIGVVIVLLLSLQPLSRWVKKTLGPKDSSHYFKTGFPDIPAK